MPVVAPRGQQLTAIVLDQLDQPDQYLTSTLQPYFVKLVLEAAVFCSWCPRYRSITSSRRAHPRKEEHKPAMALRFEVGDRVSCNVGGTAAGPWEAGSVLELNFREPAWPEEVPTAAYHVASDDGARPPARCAPTAAAWQRCCCSSNPAYALCCHRCFAGDGIYAPVDSDMCIKALHPAEDPRIGGRNRRRRPQLAAQRNTQPVERPGAAAAAAAEKPPEPLTWSELGNWDAAPDFPPPQHRPIRAPAVAGACTDPRCADPSCGPGPGQDDEATLGRTLAAIRSGEKGSGYGVEIVVGGVPHRIVQRPDGTRGVVEPSEFQRLDELRQRFPEYDAEVRAEVHWRVDSLSDCMCHFCRTGGLELDSDPQPGLDPEPQPEPRPQTEKATRGSEHSGGRQAEEETKEIDASGDSDRDSTIWSDEESQSESNSSSDSDATLDGDGGSGVGGNFRAAVQDDDGRAEALLREMLGPALYGAFTAEGEGGGGGDDDERDDDDPAGLLAADLASLALGSDTSQL